jgi:rhodanese-related sulfurtransferase
MEKSFSERVAEAKAKVSSISPREANEYKVKNPHTMFIDPRDAADIRSTTGIIPGALNVPLNELSEKPEDDLLQELSSRSTTIITACQGGPMGALAAHTLKQRGYNNVFFIDGGTQGWLDAGYTTY